MIREGRKVRAFTKEGTEIGKYDSIREAAKILYKGNNLAQHKISNMCIRARKTLLEHPTLGLIDFKYDETN